MMQPPNMLASDTANRIEATIFFIDSSLSSAEPSVLSKQVTVVWVCNKTYSRAPVTTAFDAVMAIAPLPFAGQQRRRPMLPVIWKDTGL
ncbi:MAG: hypothetical protein QOI13_1033 [Paraburkholderia sp.]|nr:hypothetical protein [Paraburkholderia sp.]